MKNRKIQLVKKYTAAAVCIADVSASLFAFIMSMCVYAFSAASEKSS